MRSRVCAAVCVALVAWAVGGCSADEDPEPKGGPAASSTSAEPTSPSTPSSSPTVEPATGKRVVATDSDDILVELRMPRGDWDLSRLGESATLFNLAGTWRFDAGVNSYTPDFDTLDRTARSRVRSYADVGQRVRRTENRVVDGVEGYVVEGHGKQGLLYEFGAFHDDATVALQFEFPNDSKKANAWVESILASVEWQ